MWKMAWPEPVVVQVRIELTYHLTHGSFVSTQFLIYGIFILWGVCFPLLFSFRILKVINRLNLFLLFIFIVLFSSHFCRLVCSFLFIVLTYTLYRTYLYPHHFARSTNRSFNQPSKPLSQNHPSLPINFLLSIFVYLFSYMYWKKDK